MAQELMRVLAGLYRTKRITILFTTPLGIDQFKVPPLLLRGHLPATRRERNRASSRAGGS